MIVEPRSRSLVILLYGTMATVESTNVISVRTYDCCEHFVRLGDLYEKVWQSPRLEFDEPAFRPLQPPEHEAFSRSRRVRQVRFHRSTSSRRFIYIMEIVQSACRNELVWQEFSFVQWRFVESPKLGVASENATMNRSQGGLHTMELTRQISATLPALTYICAVWGGDVVLKPAPCSRSISSSRCRGV